MQRVQRDFEAVVRPHPADAPRVMVIDLHGEINSFVEEELNAAYAEADGHNLPAILLNFSDVDYINSTGIALIVGLLAQAHKTHRRLLVSDLNEHYQEIFRITRLADFMTVYPDEAAALDAI